MNDKPVEPLVLKAAIRRLTCKIEFIPVTLRFRFQKERRASSR